jgi:hypothetical protein
MQLQLEDTIGREIAEIIKDHCAIYKTQIDELRAEVKILAARKYPEKGERGEPGLSITGPQGPIGNPGLAGRDGLSISAGKVMPSKNLKTGDLYLDSETGDLYEFK